jgi:exodeoxyribonuclease VIII
MKNVMIDIETLGTTPDTCILQVAAVSWGDGGIDDGISFDLSVTEQVNLGRRVDPRTLSWWMDDKVKPEVRVNVLQRTSPIQLQVGMNLLNEYIGLDKELCVWANPPQFDISIIRSVMEQCGVIPTWKHWQERDLRTLRNVCKDVGIIYDMKNENHHSAYSDARHQALEVTHLMNELKTWSRRINANTLRGPSMVTLVSPVSESIYITPNTSSQE